MRKAKVKKSNRKGRQRGPAAASKLTTAPSAPAGPRRRGRPPKVARPSLSSPAVLLADLQPSTGLLKSEAGLDLTQKVKDLLRLAKEQGHLTYEDLNNALPDDIRSEEHT